MPIDIDIVAPSDSDPRHEGLFRAHRSHPSAYDVWREARNRAGMTTQDSTLFARLDPVQAGRRPANYLAALTLDDLAALKVVTIAMARLSLIGTSWVRNQ